jgi:hypothetical protein
MTGKKITGNYFLSCVQKNHLMILGLLKWIALGALFVYGATLLASYMNTNKLFGAGTRTNERFEDPQDPKQQGANKEKEGKSKEKKGEDDEEEKEDEVRETTASATSGYELRQRTIKLFDALLKRKPTLAELRKYGSKKDESDLLHAVLRDFKDRMPDDAAEGAAKAGTGKSTETAETAETAETVEAGTRQSKANKAATWIEHLEDADGDEKICFNKNMLRRLLETL